jgi:hypothetical protein
MNNNRVPYLRTSRKFPTEIKQLTLEIDRSYIDIANAVNNRTIGIFPSNESGVTGESWYIYNNQKQQTLRQVYVFTSTASINHNITVTTISQFVRCWGSYTDGTNSYGLFWATNVAIAGQITFYITPTQIVFSPDAAAPALTSGVVVLEYLSNV